MKPDELNKELGIIGDSIDKLSIDRPIEGMDPRTQKRIRHGITIARRYVNAARRHVDGPLPPIGPKPAPRRPIAGLPSQAIPDNTSDELTGKQKQPQQKTD